MDKGKGTAEGVWISGESLWGSHGGLLEFVSVRIETRKKYGKYRRVVVIRFTDHDVRMVEDAPVDKKYYELIFSLEGG